MDTTWNNTFKRPTGARPHTTRSPSPPRAFIEPLSPVKLQTLEPQWQYHAVSPMTFTAKPEQALTETPKSRTQSASRGNGHHRSPSTIETLADAALATSPTYQSHSRKNSSITEGFTFAPPLPKRNGHGTSEPPHKRTRSEVLPSPHVGAFASRPATSYEPNGWSQNGSSQHANGYDSRVEEAALLLNFRTGGWPSHSPSAPTPLSPPNALVPNAAPRPHANSFPQDSHQIRGTDPTSNANLLPPFSLQSEQQSLWSTRPPALKTDEDSIPPHGHGQSQYQEDVVMGGTEQPAPDDLTKETESVSHASLKLSDALTSGTQSADISSSETPEAPKGRRGWPKGKPRGTGTKKTLAEKVKKAPGRKKTPDRTAAAKLAAKKSEKDVFVETAEEIRAKPRRKSFSGSVQSSQGSELASTKRAQSVPRDIPMMIRNANPSKTSRQVKAMPETICASCATSRTATASHGEMDEWISCNGCKNWFHIDCAGFKKAHEIRDVDKFFCTPCEPKHGKTTFVRKSARAHASVDYAELQKGVLKTSEESVEHHYIQPIKDGTFQFDPENFPRMRPELITKEYFETIGNFTEPICIPADWNSRPWTQSDGAVKPKVEVDDTGTANKTAHEIENNPALDGGEDAIGMVMPEGLTVRQVCNLVGPDTPLDVIDVKTQNSGSKWNLAKWADYYEEETEEKEIRNVISLEVSRTKLGNRLRRPKFVRDIDLQDSVWPREEIDKGKFPKVQFYCLMSVADSYTDFHIDFGGSSVYYHILKGKKTFFFIPPKPKHLKAYEEWNDSPQQNFTFLPHITKECYRVDLHEGDTMLIPSGWIHAVWTPATSLVIGGNFLNRMSYKNQFRVVEIEKNNETPMKFRYPFFQKIMWYTTLQYLKQDPLPEEVRQLFYDGKQFERKTPIWQEKVNGDSATNDEQVGSKNARFYSQAEMDGLPDLVNFIFRTVMVVMGRVEGTSADRIRRINMSIPKGHGDPLEIAKTFALWVTWKRGNEDPPAWAHPDAVLPNSKEDGPPKKLSARALKEMERKEAIAAYRAAPDRQSARVLAKNANATQATPSNPPATPNPQPRAATPPPSQSHAHLALQGQHAQASLHHPSFAPPVPSSSTAQTPSAMTLSMYPGTYVSTPKTSVLGPKRVACDACRKRRIRCKHKDMVMQLDPVTNSPYAVSLDHSFDAQNTSQIYDNMSATPQKGLGDAHSFATSANGTPLQNGDTPSNGHIPGPGSHAYVNANIPMVSMFGDTPKRGRSKACFECRKSKRRCVHDENGNVDPVKAAENPIPRGSVSSKKRQSTDDESSSHIKKKQKSVEFDRPPPPYHLSSAETPMPTEFSHVPVYRPEEVAQNRPQPQQSQPPIDPNLFSMYPDPSDQGYSNQNYPYQSNDQPQPFAYPSLEQIANEVLDMDGKHHEEPSDKAVTGLPPQNPGSRNGLPNGSAKTDGSVDSAVSLPSTEVVEPTSNPAELSNGTATDAGVKQQDPSEALSNGTATHDISTAENQDSVNDLPLYKPPAPLSVSPELSKRRLSASGHGPVKSAHETTPNKRKRDSVSGPGSAKKARINGYEDENTKDANGQETEDERLARLLQADDLGLRRRSK